MRGATAAGRGANDAVAWGVVVALLSASLLACEPGVPGDPALQALRVRRLGPEAFGLPSDGARAPEARLGMETREVLVAPERATIAEHRRLVARDGVVRIDLPAAELASLAAAARNLVVRRISGLDELAAAGAGEGGRRFQLERKLVDWSATRAPGADGGVRLEIEVGDLAGSNTHHIAVERISSLPALLTSGLVEAPAGARLELGFGLDVLPAKTRTSTATFTARLLCGDAAPLTVLETSVSPTEAGSPEWHERNVPWPAARSGCRVQLETSEEAASTGRAYWTVPRLVEAEPGHPRPNVVLVSLDTLRADHVSGIGYGRATSPALDRELIARGTTFTRAISTFPVTHAAHLSLFSGLYSQAQPVLGLVPEDSGIRLLAERLRDAGHHTAAFTENGYVSTHYGFSRGFLQWVEHPLAAEGRGEEIFAEGIRFVERHRERPFFLFLHTYKVHFPYTSGPAYTARFVRDREPPSAAKTVAAPPTELDDVDAYDRAIRHLDDQLASFLVALDRLGLSERTYVIVLSDHGEAFGEHGVTGHGLSAHEEQLRIPLVLRGPGIPAGRRIDTPVSLVDVAPTVLALLGLSPLEQGQGRSLLPALRPDGELEARPLYFSWIGHRNHGVRVGRWKLVRRGDRLELFDLEQDPGEQSPLPTEQRTSVLQALLDAHVEASLAEGRRLAGGTDQEPTRGVPESVEASLRALGYLE